jgi:hypothetical protein
VGNEEAGAHERCLDLDSGRSTICMIPTYVLEFGSGMRLGRYSDVNLTSGETC